MVTIIFDDVTLQTSNRTQVSVNTSLTQQSDGAFFLSSTPSPPSGQFSHPIMDKVEITEEKTENLRQL